MTFILCLKLEKKKEYNKFCQTYFWFHIRNDKIYNMTKYVIPKDIEKDATEYMKDVLSDLENRGILENTDSAALTMLARNYSVFIKASKQLEKDGLTAKARTKLPQKEKEEDDSPFTQFVKSGKETR